MIENDCLLILKPFIDIFYMYCIIIIQKAISIVNRNLIQAVSNFSYKLLSAFAKSYYAICMLQEGRKGAAHAVPF